ncbi:uncharacterized protein IWZ02DRAFT_179801 [Phyllosticta citriasiana]|uniref:uncharacterized protein n=1 Tax=Phyllosticta citriasiana TaxID=595635 RepID=UPI0030FDA13E
MSSLPLPRPPKTLPSTHHEEKFFLEDTRYNSAKTFLARVAKRALNPPTDFATRAAAEAWIHSLVPPNYDWGDYVNMTREQIKRAAIEDVVEMLRERGQVVFTNDARIPSGFDRAIGFRTASAHIDEQNRDLNRLWSTVQELRFELGVANSTVRDLTKVLDLCAAPSAWMSCAYNFVQLSKVSGWLWLPVKGSKHLVEGMRDLRRNRRASHHASGAADE